MKPFQIHKNLFVLFFAIAVPASSTLTKTTESGATRSISYDFDNACKRIGLSDGEHNIRTLETKNTNRSYVKVIQDTHTEKKYILKQLKRGTASSLQVVQEMLGTYVANKLGLLSQKVIIVPPGRFEQLKGIKNLPATLHTFIEAKPIKDFFRLSKLKLRQAKNHAVTKDFGLNRSIIKSMAKYDDLAAILATDTYLGIGDRHSANLLFSPTLQRFWLIDMDFTYRAVLVEAAIKQMSLIMKKGAHLSKQERKSLARYRKTLEKLHRMFPAEKLIALLDEFIAQAGIPTDKLKSNITPNYQSIVTHIMKSTEQVDELIDLIGRLLDSE